MKTNKKDPRLIIIFVQSLLAAVVSLYYSNFGDPIVNLQTGELFNSANGLEPCHLCWWARIFMYPIVLISGIALIYNDKKVFAYITALAVPGVLLEIYHYSLQKFNIATNEACTFANPCDALKVDYFGFMTIPFLCLVAFVVILLASTYKTKQEV